MTTIVSHSIFDEEDISSTYRRTVIDQLDNNGKIHRYMLTHPIADDIAPIIAERKISTITALEVREMDRIYQAVEEGADPTTLSSEHLPTRNVHRAIIRAAMLAPPRKVIPAAEFINTLTIAQVRNVFPNGNDANRIKTKMADIVSRKSQFEADEAAREEL